MKWKCYPLPDDDAKAKKKIVENLEVVAGTQTLGRKLLARLAKATGPMLLIAQEFLDFQRIQDYRWAGTYKGGKQLHEAVDAPLTPVGDQCKDGVARLISEYLGISNYRIAVVSELGHCRASLRHWRLPEARYGFFGDEAYPIVTHADVGNSDVVRDAMNGMQWTTGVFSQIGDPPGDLPLDIEMTESFLNEVVENTVHLVTKALDDEGYLIWCIGSAADRRLLRSFADSNRA
jgi:hypothetical protein